MQRVAHPPRVGGLPRHSRPPMSRWMRVGGRGDSSIRRTTAVVIQSHRWAHHPGQAEHCTLGEERVER